METTWNSPALEIASTVFGWTAFFVWSCSFYPQIFLNFFSKSVVGLNFNFALLNNTKNILYLIYNTSLFFSPAVRFQYHQQYGFQQIIPVAANDVAFSTHAVLMTAVLLVQIATYERGNQSISKVTIGIISGVWTTVAVCSFIAFSTNSWIWLISIFNTMQVSLAVIKYIPQVQILFLYILVAHHFSAVLESQCEEWQTYPLTLSYYINLELPSTLNNNVRCKIQAFMNFQRKSTDGFSIGMVLLDFSGGVTNYAQMVTQSIDQNSWVNFYGNIGKAALALVTIFFDILFMCQHYLLYPSKNKASTPPNKLNKAIREPLIKNVDPPVAVVQSV